MWLKSKISCFISTQLTLVDIVNGLKGHILYLIYFYQSANKVTSRNVIVKSVAFFVNGSIVIRPLYIKLKLTKFLLDWIIHFHQKQYFSNGYETANATKDVLLWKSNLFLLQMGLKIWYLILTQFTSIEFF